MVTFDDDRGTESTNLLAPLPLRRPLFIHAPNDGSRDECLCFTRQLLEAGGRQQLVTDEATVNSIPIVDISPLLGNQKPAAAQAEEAVVAEIASVCQDCGFFYIAGHGVDVSLQMKLEELAKLFFAQPVAKKREIAMRQGGRAWRGYFAVGDELTSGKPDQKEGIYFGVEHADDHPRVKDRTPLHGKNLFPNIPGFRDTVLEYIRQLEQVGFAVMEGLSLSLGLPRRAFRDKYLFEPTILFRIFHYPPLPTENAEQSWSVGEHTDYGLLTLLRQDLVGGLQIKRDGNWIDAEPIENTFVCNLGDMLERLTGGHYRSTPHRVLNRSRASRYSFPLFFDPAWDAQMTPLHKSQLGYTASDERWDGKSLNEIAGTYGEYLTQKVARVFPELSEDAL